MKYVLTPLFLVSKPKGEKKRSNRSRLDNFVRERLSSIHFAVLVSSYPINLKLWFVLRPFFMCFYIETGRILLVKRIL